MRVFFCCLFLLASCYLFGQNKLKFDILAPMPQGTIAFGYAHSTDNLFAIGGINFNKGYSSNLQVFDIETNEWLNISLENLPKQRYSSAIYIDDYKGIVLAGGISQKYRGNAVKVIDEFRIIYLEQLNIELLGTIPNPAKNLGMAHNGDKVYMFGGSTNVRQSINGSVNYTFSNKFYSYDLTNGVVDELPELPKAMETKGGIVDGNLYVFGGFDGRSLASVWQYNIAKKSWKELNKLDVTVSAYAIAQYENYFVLLGDYNNGYQVILYDTKTQEATYFLSNIEARHLGAAIMGEYLHVYGGGVTNIGGNSAVSHYKILISELIGASN